MAHEYTTLAELLTLNDANLADVEMTDLLQDAPFLDALAAEEATEGTKHSYPVEDGAPTVGFRAVNAGTENSKGSDRIVEIVLQILAASFTEDQRIAGNYKKGGAPAWMARKAKRHLKAAFAAAEKQMFYGTGFKADGFVGLAQATTVDALADTEHVVNAGGTTVGGATSVWAIRTNGDGTDCQAVVGLEGKIQIEEYFAQMLYDATGKQYPGYVQPIEGYLGLQVGSKYSIGRIVNLTTQSEKGLSDNLMSQLWEKFPATRKPNLWVMSRQSQGQLQRSRTATTSTGAEADFPEAWQKVRIITTDNIVNTEALVA